MSGEREGGKEVVCFGEEGGNGGEIEGVGQ